MTAHPFVILYVEDNELVRDTFAELLETTGRRVVCVADGAGAREALREQKIDLLMTDLELPDASGLDVAREALAQNPGLPVILCSGQELKDVSLALGPGVHSLRKPFELEELEALVERIVS